MSYGKRYKFLEPQSKTKCFTLRCFGLTTLIFTCSLTILTFNIRTMLLYYEEPTFVDDIIEDDRYSIQTEGCIIPGLIPFPKEIQKYVYVPKGIKPCPNSTNPLLKNNRTHIWVENLEDYQNDTKKTIKNLECCYNPFFKMSIQSLSTKWFDKIVQYEGCVKNFTKYIKVKDEFVKVSCGVENETIYTQYFAFAPEKKVNLYDGAQQASRTNTYNVVILGIDAVSRLNFHRTMPKTMKFLKDRGVIELIGYNKVADNSYPNLVPLVMGLKVSEIKTTCHPYNNAPYDFCPFIWHRYKNKGYYTALAEDNGATFNFIRTPTDYYIHSFIHEAKRHVGANSDVNYYLCMADKYFFRVLLDYIDDVVTVLKNSRLFAFSWESTMTHDHLNNPMVMDEHYERLLKKFDDTRYLDETILILLSDHGMRFGYIRDTKQGKLEERLPFVFILLPDSFKKEYTDAYNNLKINTKRLSTPFDVHETLIDLVNVTQNLNNEVISVRSHTQYANNRGISLFLPLPLNRTCEMAGILPHYCTCHIDVKIPIDDPGVMTAAKQLVEYINRMLVEEPQCEVLTLVKVTDAVEMMWTSPAKQRDNMITIETKPGNAKFEATMRFKNEWSVIGTPSRLNVYGKQSACVNDNKLKLYCYCKQ